LHLFQDVARPRWTSRRRWWGNPGAVAAVGIAASAGGFVALQAVLSRLSGEFAAPVFLASHRSGDPSPFRALMQGRTALRIAEGAEGQPPRAGSVYIPPSGCHLSIASDGTICVCRTERLRHVRPSADFLFETLADHFGDRTVAVVLSGSGDDGSRGVRAVRNAGGYVMCQSVATAQHGGMPQAAIETRNVDIVLSAEDIGFALATLVSKLVEGS
jgi:two-component system, chemotaxis family, protein-glutamate methylesterase/glutaminase